MVKSPLFRVPFFPERLQELGAVSVTEGTIFAIVTEVVFINAIIATFAIGTQ